MAQHLRDNRLLSTSRQEAAGSTVKSPRLAEDSLMPHLPLNHIPVCSLSPTAWPQSLPAAAIITQESLRAGCHWPSSAPLFSSVRLLLFLPPRACVQAFPFSSHSQFQAICLLKPGSRDRVKSTWQKQLVSVLATPQGHFPALACRLLTLHSQDKQDPKASHTKPAPTGLRTHREGVGPAASWAA